MKYNLKDKPNLEWIINQPRTKERIDDAYATILDMKHWFEDFEKQLQKRKESIKKSLKTAIMPIKVGYEWELAIINEILGDSK